VGCRGVWVGGMGNMLRVEVWEVGHWNKRAAY
jgi:hypothetical protein